MYMAKAYEVKGAVNPEIFDAHLDSSSELRSIIRMIAKILMLTIHMFFISLRVSQSRKAANFRHLCPDVAISS